MQLCDAEQLRIGAEHALTARELRSNLGELGDLVTERPAVALPTLERRQAWLEPHDTHDDRATTAAPKREIEHDGKENPASLLHETGFEDRPGGVLLSHSLTQAVPSALEGLTSEFGMGSGMAPPTLPPEDAEVCLSTRLHGSKIGQSPVVSSSCALPSFVEGYRGAESGSCSTLRRRHGSYSQPRSRTGRLP